MAGVSFLDWLKVEFVGDFLALLAPVLLFMSDFGFFALSSELPSWKLTATNTFDALVGLKQLVAAHLQLKMSFKIAVWLLLFWSQLNQCFLAHRLMAVAMT